MRTSFHHQPEAQHPIFQLSTSWQADYPIFWGQSGHQPRFARQLRFYEYRYLDSSQRGIPVRVVRRGVVDRHVEHVLVPRPQVEAAVVNHCTSPYGVVPTPLPKVLPGCCAGLNHCADASGVGISPSVAIR